MKFLQYKGYHGSIEYSADDGLLYGKVLGIASLLSYEGIKGSDLEKNFQNSIDAYLDHCKESGAKPEKPFKGSFNVRIPSQLHEEAALNAKASNTSLNSLVAESIRDYLARR